MENVLRFKVKLPTPEDVKKFTQEAMKCPRSVTIKAIHNEYIVDGRSILGLLSLDLSKPITIELKGIGDISQYIKYFNGRIVKN